MAATENRCYGCFEPAGDQARCSQCGYDHSALRSPLFLPHGTVLAEQYEIGRVLGEPGGFGITYLGWDRNLHVKVAIKEYMPKSLAGRDSCGLQIAVHSDPDTEAYEFGREKFLSEARTVAQFKHPNIVAVRQFFTANNTAYIVMDYYEGETLSEYLQFTEPVLPAGAAIKLIRPILAGLAVVHDKSVLHRDVKPANIYLASIGQPILIDFSAARFATGFRSQSLSVVLTEGYAPIEQYQRRGNQGPWTDVYGAAATLFRMMTGEAPPIAVDRIGNDPLGNMRERLPHAIPVADVLARALAVRPADRTPSADVLIHDLDKAMEKLIRARDEGQDSEDTGENTITRRGYQLKQKQDREAGDLTSNRIATLSAEHVSPGRSGLTWVPIATLVLALLIVVLVLTGLPEADLIDLPIGSESSSQRNSGTPRP